MTNQRAFNIVTRHLRKQKQRSLIAGQCTYRGHGKLRCAIGALIPDKLYNLVFEKLPLVEIQNRIPALKNVEYRLLSELRMVHDYYSPHNWEAALVNVSIIFKLKVPR